MDSVSVRSRCASCRRGLPFAEWQQGESECRSCRSAPVSSRRASYQAESPTPLATDYRAYSQMVDEIPDELVDELLAALEQEAGERKSAARDRPGTLLNGVLDEIGIGTSSGELPWALWGFAAGFALNVALAKYAQMSSGGTMGEFLPPMVLGGLLAGATCAAIGWGIARLRER